MTQNDVSMIASSIAIRFQQLLVEQVAQPTRTVDSSIESEISGSIQILNRIKVALAISPCIFKRI
jgi:sensor domain CHASE-containing protein